MYTLHSLRTLISETYQAAKAVEESIARNLENQKIDVNLNKRSRQVEDVRRCDSPTSDLFGTTDLYTALKLKSENQNLSS